MGRRGVAATIVSFVVFTSLLLANSALYSSANSGLSAALTSSMQVKERTTAGVLDGVSGFDALSSVQDFVQSNPLDCASPQAYFDSLAGSASGTGSEGGMSYVTRTSWSYATDLTASGDDSTLSPFNGYEAGALNLYVSVEVDESYDGGLPSYSTQSAETVHLPMALSSSISLCLSALSDLGAALSSLQSCNSTGVASATASAETTYPVLGAFELGVSSSPQQSGCLVTYSVMTTEAGTGVSGGFQWSVWGEGSLDASVPPGSLPSGA